MTAFLFNLLIAKLHAYGFSNETLMLLVSYLTGRKQCVKNNIIFSFYKKIISGVPQGSILGPILFNIFINDIFVLLSADDIHNFADDNTITALSETIQDLINALQNKTERAIKWMENNNMIAKSDNFKPIILTKDRKDNSNLELNFCEKKIKTSDKVQFLGITIDQRLSFEQHISEICRKASGQLNALTRLGSYLRVETRQAAVDAFILANFNYCPVVCYFSTSKQMQKIEQMQGRALRFILNGYKLDYESLLVESNNVTMEVKRMRSLCIEVFKTLNGLNRV